MFLAHSPLICLKLPFIDVLNNLIHLIFSNNTIALTSHHRFVNIILYRLTVLSHRQHVLIWARKNATAKKELHCYAITVEEIHLAASIYVIFQDVFKPNPTKSVKQK